MTLGHAQFEALFPGLDWRRVRSVEARANMLDAPDLPDDIAALKAMLIATQAREVRKDDQIERLEKLVAAFKQAAFGRKCSSSHTSDTYISTFDDDVPGSGVARLIVDLSSLIVAMV